MTRRVMPREALEAERFSPEDDAPDVEDHWTVYMWREHYEPGEFEWWFVDADLFDAVLTAARNAVRYNPNGGDWIMDLRAALRAYDEGQAQ